ncbi:MAG: sigma factor, partial [Candidatus Binataceae bacterium]
MPKFYVREIEELALQLNLSPRRLRMEQLRGVDTLLGLVDPNRAYPYEFACYHVTNFQKRRAEAGALIPGQALIDDLATLVEVVSRKATLVVAEIGEPFLSHEAVSKELRVSTKTIRRWRNHGLTGLRAVCADGVNRLVFLRRTVDRFVKQHAALVEKGASFSQLSGEERTRIIDRARELLSQKRLKLHAVAKLIAEETGRAVETVRYTLRRYDASAGSTAIFAQNGEPQHCAREAAVLKGYDAGDSVESVAQALDTTTGEIARTLRTARLRRWKHTPWECIHHELFDAPNAEALLLEAAEPVGEECPPARIPKDLPPYLRQLYLTPLLSREQEHDLFRRYNYLKYKAAKALRTVDPDSASQDEFDGVESLSKRIEDVRQRITRANLRLVVSIAKKHVGWSSNFFEVVSDGNMSLMRAIEKFDFSRGTKFSTYASWAIMKNYARSIPEQHYHSARYITGQD